MNPSKAASSLVLASLLLGVTAASAQPEAPTVVLAKEPPFDAWSPARVRSPAALSGRADAGLLEEKLTKAFADSLQATASAALDRAVADLARALAASALGEGDVGGAVVRAGLTYTLQASLPADAGCAGSTRIDALYEGLATSAALAPLAFPAKTGKVTEACAATARRAARAADAAALASVVTADVRTGAASAKEAIERATTACGSKPASTIADLARELREAPPADATEACVAAKQALRSVDGAALEALVAAGLGSASLDAVLAASAGTDAIPAIVARVATGHLDADTMKELARTLAAATLPDARLLRDAVAAVPDAIVVRDGVATIDAAAVLGALGRRYDSDQEGKPVLRSSLLTGDSPFTFELNGGLPQVDFSDLKVVADVGGAYTLERFGVAGRGWIDTYTFDDAQTHDDYTHTGGSLEGYWLSGARADRLRWEIRGSAAFDYYDTTSYPKREALRNFFDFDSRMGRGTALVGFRYRSEDEKLSATAGIGGGVQYEDPDTTTFTGGRTLSLTSDQNLTLQTTARANVRFRVVPRVLGVRFRADAFYFRITREELFVTGTAGAATTDARVDRQQQLELHGRLFVDADVASLAGFVPAVFGGLDYLGIEGTKTSSSRVVPIVGIGIVRH